MSQIFRCIERIAESYNWKLLGYWQKLVELLQVKIDFSNISSNCQINSQRPSSRLSRLQGENQIGLVYVTILLALIWLTYTSISKRQTEKPPIVSKDEQEGGEDV